MSDIVVDSSVVAKWVVPESDSPLAQRVAAETQTAGGRLIVLDLVLPEVVNVIWKKHRQKLITLEKAKESLDDLKRSPLHIERASTLLNQAFEIAVKYDRAVYDALFVALARDLGLKRGDCR
jgi:predicted nucleic acid-binding protein